MESKQRERALKEIRSILHIITDYLQSLRMLLGAGGLISIWEVR